MKAIKFFITILLFVVSLTNTNAQSEKSMASFPFKGKSSNVDEIIKRTVDSFFNAKFQESLENAEKGLKKEPRNQMLNRMAMYSNYELKNFEAAKTYIHRLFYESDNVAITLFDHYYAALIYEAVNYNRQALDEFNKALKLSSDDSVIKRWQIMKSISDIHTKENDFSNAIIYYLDYLQNKNELNSGDLEDLANLYIKYANVNETKRDEIFERVIKTYQEIGSKFLEYTALTSYLCGVINNKIDVNDEEELAKPYFLKVVDLIVNKNYQDKSENDILKNSYQYLMTNAIRILNNKFLAKEYANKILAIDPGYEPALQVKNIE